MGPRKKEKTKKMDPEKNGGVSKKGEKKKTEKKGTKGTGKKELNKKGGDLDGSWRPLGGQGVSGHPWPFGIGSNSRESKKTRGERTPTGGHGWGGKV